MKRENGICIYTYAELEEVSKRDELTFRFMKNFRKLSADASEEELYSFCKRHQTDLYVYTEYENIQFKIDKIKADIMFWQKKRASIGEASLATAFMYDESGDDLLAYRCRKELEWLESELDASYAELEVIREKCKRGELEWGNKHI